MEKAIIFCARHEVNFCAPLLQTSANRKFEEQTAVWKVYDPNFENFECVSSQSSNEADVLKC